MTMSPQGLRKVTRI